MLVSISPLPRKSIHLTVVAYQQGCQLFQKPGSEIWYLVGPTKARGELPFKIKIASKTQLAQYMQGSKCYSQHHTTREERIHENVVANLVSNVVAASGSSVQIDRRSGVNNKGNGAQTFSNELNSFEETSKKQIACGVKKA